MNNNNNDVVVLELDKIRNLRYGSKALKMIEKTFNCKITNMNLDNMGIDEVNKMIFAGLTQEDSSLTLEQLEELLDKHMTFGEQLTKMTEAFNLAFGIKKVDKTDPNA